MSIIVFLTRSFHQLKISFMFKFIVFLFTVALGMAVYGSYQLLYGIEDQFTVWGLKIEPTSIQMLFLPLVMATVAGFFLYLLLPEKVGNYLGFLMIAVTAFAFFPIIFQVLHLVIKGDNLADKFAFWFAFLLTIFLTLVFLSKIETRIANLEQKKLQRKKNKFSMTMVIIWLLAFMTIVLYGLYFNHTDFELPMWSNRLKIDVELYVRVGAVITGVGFICATIWGLKDVISENFFRVILILGTLASVFLGIYVWGFVDQTLNIISSALIALIFTFVSESIGARALN